MSRILNRPMFRGGGKVSSYGKGIASGLGYAKGGRIAPDGRIKFNIAGLVSPEMASEYARGQGTLRTGSASTTGANVVNQAAKKTDRMYNAGKKTTNFFKNFVNKIKPTKGIISNLFRTAGQPLYGAIGPTVGAGGITAASAAIAPAAAVYGLSKLNEPKTLEALEFMKQMNDSGVNDETGALDYEDYSKTFLELNDVTKYTPLKDSKIGLASNQKDIAEAIIDEDMKGMEEVTTESGAKVKEGETALDALLREGLERAEARDKIENPEKPTELSMKEQVAKDKELFAELLGEGEARGKDISDMLLRFAGSGGDTVGQKFQQYIGAEAMAGPSRTEKINQAAASLAINDYIAGKRSKENMKMMLEKTKYGVDYTIKAQEERDSLKNKDFVKAVGMEATAQKKKPSDNNVIAAVIYKQTGTAPKIVSDFANENYGADVDIDIEKLNTGLNIVTFKNAKIVIEKDPTGNLRIATEYPVY